MEYITVITIVVAIIAVILVVVVDNAFDRLFDWFLGHFKLESGKGPLKVEANVGTEWTVLSLVNQGKHVLFVMAIEGRDSDHKRTFPTPYLSENDLGAEVAEEKLRKNFLRIMLKPDQLTSVFLKTSELVGLGCQSLAFLDSKGRSWPVDNYDLSRVNYNN